MFTPIKSGVYLRQINTSQDAQVIIKLIRASEYPGQTMGQFVDVLAVAPTVILRIDNDGASRLDFDPGSDINVVPGNHIDDNDTAALTDLALAFYQQAFITDGVVYVYRLPAESPEIKVNVEVYDVDEEAPQLYYEGVYPTRAVDSNSPFEGRKRNPVTGQELDYGTALNALIQAFINLKL